MLLTLLQTTSTGISVTPLPPIFTGERENYTGRYLVTANRLAPYLHGSVWKKSYRDRQ